MVSCGPAALRAGAHLRGILEPLLVLGNHLLVRSVVEGLLVLEAGMLLRRVADGLLLFRLGILRKYEVGRVRKKRRSLGPVGILCGEPLAFIEEEGPRLFRKARAGPVHPRAVAAEENPIPAEVNPAPAPRHKGVPRRAK